MPRLPIPGDDAGDWGNLLNDFLRQVHTENGTLKAGVVKAVQLGAGSVTAPAIQNSSIVGAKLADDTIPDTKLTEDVRDKLDALAAVTDGREVELQADGSHIQWRYAGDGIWTNLVALADITGAQGAQGVQGEPGPQGLQGVKGDPGDPATNLITSVNGRTGVVTGLAEQSDLTGKLSSVNTPNIIYATDVSGNQVGVSYGQSATSGSIVRRTDTGQIITTTPTVADHAATKGYVDTAETVRYTAQSLTAPQQAQVRTNIGAARADRTIYGTGSPLGAVSAPVGTKYIDEVGTLGAWEWLKKSGTGNTGWEVIHGDTGDISVPPSSLENGWTRGDNTSGLLLRRINSVVMLVSNFTGSSTTLNNTDSTDIRFIALPIGFRKAPSTNYSMVGTARVSATIGVLITDPNHGLACTASTAKGATTFNVDWTTADPWISALPY